MIEIKRKKHCLIVYENSKKRGIACPKGKEVALDVFLKDLGKISKKMETGIVLVPLVFDSKYTENYRPMEMFLNGRSPDILDSDENAEELYNFYFSKAILELSPGRISFKFIG